MFDVWLLKLARLFEDALLSHKSNFNDILLRTVLLGPKP